MNAFAGVAICVAFIACVTDVRAQRIPNLLTFGAALAALIVHGVDAGRAGVGMAIGGWVSGTALFLPFFLLGGMGAGDVKLLAALGAWLGPHDIFWLAIYASLAGGVVAVIVAVWHGYLGHALRNVRSILMFWLLVGPKPVPGMTLQNDAPRLAYALPIFVGTVLTVWLR